MPVTSFDDAKKMYNFDGSFDGLNNLFKNENEIEKEVRSTTDSQAGLYIFPAAGTSSPDSTTNSQKEATETSDSDKSSSAGKLLEDDYANEGTLKYPTEIQSLGDTIKHWMRIEISDIKSETLRVETLEAGLGDVAEGASNALKSIKEKASEGVGGLMESASNFISDQFSVESIAGNLKKGAQIGTALTKELKGMIKTVRKDAPNNKLRATLEIYMPDTLLFNQRNNYDERSFDQVFGTLGQIAQIGSAIGSDTAAGLETGGTRGMVNSLMRTPAGREAVGRLAGPLLGASSLEEGLVKSTGYAINPQVELFFTGVDRRSFQFDFRFNSRSAKETQNIQKIIKLLRKYAAPTFPQEGSGRYWIPPSIFDITFLYRDPENKSEKVNDKLPKINRCVLESIDVNYNGSGKYITYEDGQPIDIEVRLMFKETDIMTRAEIEAGY